MLLLLVLIRVHLCEGAAEDIQ